MTNVGLSSPWNIFCKKVMALFECDAEVTIKYDDNNTELKLYVDNPVKADAIAKLLPVEKEFGNVTLKITVIPSNKDDPVGIINAAFNENPVLKGVTTRILPDGSSINYAMFNSSLVSLFTDDLSDPNGYENTLFHTIAKEVLIAPNGTYFCLNCT